MATKAGILEQIGERSLLLPELINHGLAANDRLKSLPHAVADGVRLCRLARWTGAGLAQ